MRNFKLPSEQKYVSKALLWFQPKGRWKQRILPRDIWWSTKLGFHLRILRFHTCRRPLTDYTRDLHIIRLVTAVDWIGHVLSQDSQLRWKSSVSTLAINSHPSGQQNTTFLFEFHPRMKGSRNTKTYAHVNRNSKCYKNLIHSCKKD